MASPQELLTASGDTRKFGADKVGVDDTDLMVKTLNYAAKVKETVQFDRWYVCERTVKIDNPSNLSLWGTGTGGEAGIKAYTNGDEVARPRERAHLVLGRGGQGPVQICQGFGIEGPHGYDQPSKSPGNVYEAQHGIWLWGTMDWLICNPWIKKVWGDGVNPAWTGVKDQLPAQNGTVIGGIIERTGRCGTSYWNGNNILWAGVTFKNIAASIIDVEPQTTSLLYMHNVTYKDIYAEDIGGLALHIQNPVVIDGFTMSGWVRPDDPVSCFVVGTKAPDGTRLIRGVSILNNEWGGPQEGGRCQDYRRVDGLTVVGQKGPYSGVRSPDPIYIEDCINVTEGPNQLVNADVR